MNIEAYLQEELKSERAWGRYTDACHDLAAADTDDERIQFEAIVKYQYVRWRAIQAGIRKKFSAERTAYRRSQIRAA